MSSLDTRLATFKPGSLQAQSGYRRETILKHLSRPIQWPSVGKPKEARAVNTIGVCHFEVNVVGLVSERTARKSCSEFTAVNSGIMNSGIYCILASTPEIPQCKERSKLLQRVGAPL